MILALLVQAGCSSGNDHEETAKDDVVQDLPLRVVVIETPRLAESLRAQWLAHDGGEIQIHEQTVDELRTTRRLLADVIVYPSAMMGELVVSGHLQPLSFPDGEPGWSGEAVLANQRVAEVSWGSDLYAVSFGSPQPMLAYRRDIFQQQGLSPPATWADYLETCRTLDEFRSSSAGEAFSQTTAEPSAGGDLAISFLARAASYARHRNQYSGLFDFISMEPLIAGPPFQRALAELVECRQFQDTGNLAGTSADAFERVLTEDSLMAISWSFRHPGDTAAAEKPVAGMIAVAELPGSAEVYNANSDRWEARQTNETVHVPLLASGGRLGSVTELAHDRMQATDFLMFMTSSRMATMVCRPSPHTFPFRTSHAEDPRGWLPGPLDGIAAASFGEAVKAAGERNNYLFCLRIPGRQKYLAALDKALLAALAGETPAVALGVARRDWQEITKNLGLDQQKAAYRSSLGLDN